MTARRFPLAEDLVPLRVAAPRTPVPGRWPSLFADAMAVSTALAVVAGITLGTLAAADLLPADRWSAAVQSHGRLQLFGWCGVFVSALLFEFGARLNQRPPLAPVPRAVALVLMGGGAIVSAAGQLFHDSFGWAWLVGTLLTLTGGALVAVLIFRLTMPLRGRGFHSWWLRASAAWLVIAAGASVVIALRGSGGVAELAESRFAIEAMIRGFLLMAMAGVAIRAFAGHLDLQPLLEPRQRVAFGAFNLSLLAWLAGSGAFGLPLSTPLQRGADVVFAASLVAFTAWLGVLRRFRLDRSPPRYRLVIPWAWAGLVVYAVALGLVAVSPGWAERDLYEVGALRHLFLVGFVAPLMIAMAHVVLARFGTGHLHCGPALAVAFALIQPAWLLRVAPVVVRGLPDGVEKVLLAASGGLAAAALAFLATASWQTARAVRDVQRRA